MGTNKPFDDAFTFKDDLGVRDIYADGVHAISLGGPIAKFTFTVSRPDDMKPGHKGPPKGHKVPVARVAMSAQGFADLYNKMHHIIMALEGQGLFTREDGKAKATLQ